MHCGVAQWRPCVFCYALNLRVAFFKGKLFPLQYKMLIMQLAQDVSGV